ncbi:IS66 family transposase zinc-finger binding domain-containing protein [[Clostridium] scindens]|nr:IS66 family transposase zinc-finger binding domain-containing protein [[Clostridium] scindens]
MVLIGEEYVRRELEFVPSTCKFIEYYSQSYGCPSCKEDLGDTKNL